MATQQIRPNVVPTIALLHVVFGGLGVVCALLLGSTHLTTGSRLFAIVGRPALDREQEQIAEELPKFVEKKFPNARILEYADQGLNLLLSVMMLVSAFGLLRWEAWGRRLSIVYAWLSIAVKVFAVVYTYTVLLPLVREFLRSVPPRADADAAFINALGIFLSIVPFVQLLFMIYPLVVLFVMLGAPVTAAFLGPEAVEQQKDPYARFRSPERSGPNDRRPGGPW